MQKNLKSVFFLVALLFAFTSCTKNTVEEPIVGSLNVQFSNDINSDYTITNIEIRSRGLIGEEDQPIGAWGANALTGGSTLAPGESTSFILNMAPSSWSEYRISVDDGNGHTVLVLTDGLVGIKGALPISNIENKNRKVNVVVKYSSTNDVIYISSWSDFAPN